MPDDDSSSVRVAVRIRPQVPREVIDMCRMCTSMTPGEPQVTLGQDKSFTFDIVFDTDAVQHDVYDACVQGLVRSSLDGYNATVLAYGQTGSGKTYTMGTAFEMELIKDQMGIIPRAINDLFAGIEERTEEYRSRNQIPPEFKVVAQFMELYNEEIIDLFDPARDPYGSKALNGRLKIHEDTNGGIKVSGVTLKPVTSAQEAMQCLRLGALSRTTAATGMNAQSSRSHAVFTLHIKQQRLVRVEDLDSDMNMSIEPRTEFETLTAKFHFVDLAGSERLKRTGATGDRAKEGISINCGLLALGNVISALGDKSKKVSHVPYRDSKLTRLLQDSLGGNSQTVMIACISPSDRDFMETLNTLKYANRARNIKNKIIVNQDKSSRTISILRQEIAQLQLELLEFKQGKRIVSENGEEGINDMFHENTVLQTELNNLRTRVKALQGTIDQLSHKNSQLLAEKAMSSWIKSEGGSESTSGVAEMVQNYLKEIEDLRSKLLESNNMYEMLKKNYAAASKAHNLSKSLILGPDVSLLNTSSTVLNNAKRELYKEKEILARSMGEMEYSRKLSQSTLSSRLSDMGEREGAEGESGGDSDEIEDEESESEDDTDSENKVCALIGAELEALSGDIDTKQRLIEELELSQRRLHSMRLHYEDKLMALHTQIKLTQEERDKVLASYAGSQSTTPTDKIKRVKEEYERKITDMQREMKRLQAAQKEHSKMLRAQASCDTQIRTMKNELSDMKRNKVKLLNKMKEESARHKQTENMRNREIAQLRKESRKTANVIKSLEAEKKIKEQILKRKQEEVTALRKGNKKSMSNKVAGRLPDKPFSSKSAKIKWQSIEKTISKVAINKQAICDMERDMERLLSKRDSLGKEFERLKHQRTTALMNRLDTSEIDNEIDTVKSNIEYIQDSITEAQHHIMQIEEAKDTSDTADIQIMANRIQDISEARYIIEKLYNMTINQVYETSQKENLLKDSQAKLQEMKEENGHQQSVLRQMLNGGTADVLGLLPSPTGVCVNNNDISSGTSTRSVSPVDSAHIELAAKYAAKQASAALSTISSALPPLNITKDLPPVQNQSFERNSTHRGSVRLREIGVISRGDKKLNESSPMTQSMGGEVETSPRGQPLARVPSAPGSLRGLTPQKTYPLSDSPGPDLPRPSPFLSRKTYNINYSGDSPPLISPRLNRRPFPERQGSFSMQHPLIGKPGSMEAGMDSCTPPGSPPPNRRTLANRDDNVFSRLTGNNLVQDHYVGGLIKESTNKGSDRSPLRCTHIAEGHTSAVLTLYATDDMLLSGSADRTVKVWDLTTGQEQHTLVGHPNNVRSVRYDPMTRLVYSVSGAYVRVWDLRSSPQKAIRTLCSSGTTQSSVVPLTAVSRTVQLPAGETHIYDIMLNKQGTTLYTTSNDRIRIWDLRMFECCGKWVTGHQAAVMCLAVGPLTDVNDIVVTGSKDHYIKVFEVSGGGSGINSTCSPRLHLEPPHYDGVQCLALNEDVLFSGSRDTSIKKWDLNSQEPPHTVYNAHKGWVNGLAYLKQGDLLVSGCRTGQLKLWDANTCKQLAFEKADNFGINHVATNSSQIFTASNDGKVRFWSVNTAKIGKTGGS